MLTPWRGGFATAVVILLAIGLLAGDLADVGFRSWWEARPLTTDMVSGLLALLVTVLIVDQVVRRRQVRDRARAVGAQAAIVLGQAVRAAQAVTAALSSGADRESASDEVRTYMLMLLVGAPVLIDAPVSRDFLEQAQRLGAEMARAGGLIGKKPAHDESRSRIDRSLAQLRTASAPLLQQIDFQELSAAGDPSAPATGSGASATL